MSNFKIIGNPNPAVGEQQTYSIQESFNLKIPKNDISEETNLFSQDIHWSIYQYINNKWTHKPKNDKIGRVVHYNFFEATLHYKGIRLIAQYGNEQAVLNIKTQKSTERKIAYVDFLDANYKKPTRPFAYGDILIARVHCVNLNNCAGSVTLWEDDTPGAGHSAINKNNKASTLPIYIKDGKGEAKFILSPDFAKMANAQFAKGQQDEGKFHEYYVTVEIFNQKLFESQNVNVINFEYKKVESKEEGPAAKKGPSKKEIKGITTSERSVFDYLEQKIAVKPIINYDFEREFVNSLLTVDIGDPMWNKKKSACVCKEYDLVWGNKFTCDERKKVIQLCKNLWPSKNSIEMANQLMICMALETAESFTASKGFPQATGLVQFTDSALQGMNEKNRYNNGIILTKERLSKMTVLEQLNYVELYFKMWIDHGKIIKDSLDMYMCIWCPAAVGKDNTFICYSEQKDKDAKDKDPKAIQPYNSNKSIDGEYYQEKGNVVLKGKKDTEIRKEELKPRLEVKTVLGKLNKATSYDCDLIINNGACLDTWDNATNVKIKALHPKIQCLVKNFINDVEESMGIKLRVIQGYRTYEEQDNLYAQGRTKSGSIITKAKGGESNHNFGLAIDVAEIKNGIIDWEEQEIVLPKIAPIGKKWGFEWGGDWKSFKDKPHFEMVFGKTTEDLRILNKEMNNDYTKIKL